MNPTSGPREIDHEELSRTALTALAEMDRAAARLAAAEVTGRSRDGRIVVRVNATGELTAIRLRDGALRSYGSAALGEAVTRTLRATQLRARAAYEEAVARLAPPEVAESERIVSDALRRAVDTEPWR